MTPEALKAAQKMIADSCDDGDVSSPKMGRAARWL